MNSTHDLSWAHPLVQEWFLQTFNSPTEPQEKGWHSILQGKTTLIAAPTGSGKTLASFLICIDYLVRLAVNNQLKAQTDVLYISPLKALSHDVQKNLLIPLQGIAKLALEKGYQMEPIEVAVRTGDTTPYERQTMLKKAPHILVTTPESFYLLLTSQKGRNLLKPVKTVIVDEIHALANNKRGTHLSLSLERLEHLVSSPFIRIGLSATQKPITKIANFLNGNRQTKPIIVNIGHMRELDLNIEIPSIELAAVASNELWETIYDRLAELAKKNRSTLIFANTRRLAERVAHHLSNRLGEENVTAHHGSLSRKLRLDAETRLKNGQLKALVATASLELGLDIGDIDLVCQLGSPRSIAIAIQRIGRSGHWRGAISKGHFFPTTLDELFECAALIFSIKQGHLDSIIIPKEPIDILTQQIIAACAAEDWQEDHLFQLVKKSYPYKNLKRGCFNSLITMLSEGITGSRSRYGNYLIRDQVHSILKGRRGARLAALTSGGAIPENGLFTVLAEPTETMVGTLDEDFAVESNRGDIILLGNTSWKIVRIESSRARVLVEDAHGAPPTVPFWRGEAPNRTDELSLALSKLREKLSHLLPKSLNAMQNPAKDPQAKKALDWLITHCEVSLSGAEQMVDYLLLGRSLLGVVPTQQTLIAERFFDESGAMQLIIHSPYGARINKAFGLALRKRFCRSFNFELQAAATDDGINISLAEQHSFPLIDVFHFLNPHTVKKVLIQAILQSPLFNTRWRWCATRSLAVLRFRQGKKTPPHLLRMLCDDLLKAIFPDAAACQDNLAGQDIELPSHPLIDETMKDALTEALDLEGLIDLLTRLHNGKVACIAVDTPMPSVFSHEILNANPYAYLDDAPLEERRARAVQMRRTLPDSLIKNLGMLSPFAIEEVKTQAWPEPKDKDELQDYLQLLIGLPIEIVEKKSREQFLVWNEYFEELIREKRAGLAIVHGKKFWVSPEKKKCFDLIYPTANFEQKLSDIPITFSSRDDALVEYISSWMNVLGPTTSIELSEILGLEMSEIEQSLLYLETRGTILRGSFEEPLNTLQWCERRLLARIHRLTLGKLRKEIECVSPAQFMRWLLEWHHLTPNTQLSGEHGLLEVIRQLQGFELPSNAWEKDIFEKRVKNYSSDLLDKLCLSGLVCWGRLSPHRAFIDQQDNADGLTKRSRISPTSTTPISFFIREESLWLGNRMTFNTSLKGLLNPVAESIYDYLNDKGASFLFDIMAGISHIRSEVEMGLWELVCAGLITADGFDNLRALINKKRRLRKSRFARPITGRWSLLKTLNNASEEAQIEATCFVLLKRYGVVFRELLTREKITVSWRDLLLTFRKLEARGEIRGGRFVSGFLGEQFALPYAVDSLRLIKNRKPDQTFVEISAVDPLNLIGIVLPGQRSSYPSRKIMIINGELIHQEKLI